MSCNRCDMTSKQLNPCADCLANIETYKAMRADHGISPAQLRERVEALELRVTALTGINNVQEQRIDAALKRIEAMDLVIKEQYRAIGLLNERVHLLERDMFDVHPNALSAGKA